MYLKNKTVIVTGGGNGIGKAICLKMATLGANVVVTDIAVDAAQKVAEEIIAMGRKAIALKVDIVESADTIQMAEEAVSVFGKIDVLVNNAGGAGALSREEKNALFHESTEESWDYIMTLNLRGIRNGSHAVLPHMIEKRCGNIINMASLSGMNGTIRRVAYSTAKAGIIGFTRVLAKEVAPFGIRVNSISPGPIATELFLNNTEEYIENGKKGVHLGRLGKPEEIAAMAAFLAMEEADYITGQNLVVDGGKSLGI